MKRTATPETPRDGAPPTRVEELVEEIHGVAVADPYRWLEDGRSEEVRRWVDAQNAHTGTVLSAYPHRAAVERRLTRLLSIGTLSAPEARNGRELSLALVQELLQVIYIIERTISLRPQLDQLLDAVLAGRVFSSEDLSLRASAQ